MNHGGSAPNKGWLYVARRVWWRLLAALYKHRLRVIGVIISLVALALVSLICGGLPT